MLTYIYIKKHRITNLKYFGKTISKDPEKYKGSGTYWLRHLKIHGNFVDTLCLWEFENINQCKEFCLNFSRENDIAKSKEWANIIEEDGVNYPPSQKGIPKTPEHNEKNRLAHIGLLLGKPQTIEHIKKRVKQNIGKKRTDKFKEHRSILMIGNKNTIGKIWIHNDHNEIMVDKDKFSNNEYNGYIKGRLVIFSTITKTLPS